MDNSFAQCVFMFTAGLLVNIWWAVFNNPDVLLQPGALVHDV